MSEESSRQKFEDWCRESGNWHLAEDRQAFSVWSAHDAEVSALKAQLDHERGWREHAVKQLMGIHALLYPPPTATEDGRVVVFRPKNIDPHEVLQELSDRIRALPDEIALRHYAGMLHECAPYLKDGETPAKRIERELADSESLLTLLIKEKYAKEAIEVKYNELLFAVVREFDGETRHETALRYIQNEAAVITPKWDKYERR